MNQGLTNPDSGLVQINHLAEIKTYIFSISPLPKICFPFLKNYAFSSFLCNECVLVALPVSEPRINERNSDSP